MPSSQGTGLLSLPAELRNMIYDEVAQAEKGNVVLAMIDEHTKTFLDSVVASAPFAKVCRQLRVEAGPVIKAATAFAASDYRIHFKAFDFEKLSQLSDRIARDLGAAPIRYRNLHLHFELGNRAVSTASRLAAQVKDHIEHEMMPRSPLRFVRYLRPATGNDGQPVSSSAKFNFRFKGMSARERGTTITHEQVREVSKILYELLRLLKKRLWLAAWREDEAVTFCHDLLASAYGDYRRRLRNP